MSDDPKQLLLDYEHWKQIEREAKAKIEELAPKVLPLIPEDKEVQLEHGYFYIQKRPSWTYSAEVTSAEKSLKEAKKKEEADGTAKATYTPILYYKNGEPKPQE